MVAPFLESGREDGLQRASNGIKCRGAGCGPSDGSENRQSGSTAPGRSMGECSLSREGEE